MDRQTWADLPTFVAVARSSSFTAAASALGVSPSAVSHAVRAMEARIGTRLFNRTTRSVALTAAGEQLLAALDPVIGGLDVVIGGLERQRLLSVGRVRISAHRTAARFAVLPKLSRLRELHPGITLELMVDDGLVDIVAAGFDAGVRRSAALAPDMISVRLDDGAELVYVASSSYLEASSSPLMPADLLGHSCINYRYPTSTEIHRWTFERGAELIEMDVPGHLVVNDVDLAMDAALGGYGIACLTADQVEAELGSGRLTRVLAEWSPKVPGNHLYYPGRRHVPPALRAVIDLLRSGTRNAAVSEEVGDVAIP